MQDEREEEEGLKVVLKCKEIQLVMLLMALEQFNFFFFLYFEGDLLII